MSMLKRGVARYEPKVRVSSFILRLPEKYSLALDGLVKGGAAKSRNELIVELIGIFLSDLRKKAEMTKVEG